MKRVKAVPDKISPVTIWTMQAAVADAKVMPSKNALAFFSPEKNVEKTNQSELGTTRPNIFLVIDKNGSER